MRAVQIGRRPFLAGSALALGGLALGLRSDAAQAASEPKRGVQGAGAGFSPNVFLHVAPDGWVSVVCHRSEMGQ